MTDSSSMISSSLSDTQSDFSGSTFSNLNPTEPPETLSILQGLGYSAAQCGYCAEEKGARSRRKGGRSYGCWAHVLSCKTYKDLIDRGWRRSGKYLYKPDMATTCCPQYTISLDADAFVPSKSQRQLLSRFNHHIQFGGRDNTPGWGPVLAKPAAPSSQAAAPRANSPSKPAPPPIQRTHSATKDDSQLTASRAVTFNPGAEPKIDRANEDNAEFLAPTGSRKQKQAHQAAKRQASQSNQSKKDAKGKGKASSQSSADLSELVHAAEWSNSPASQPFAHSFSYSLEPASFTEEKYALFHKYQTEIHGEPASKVTPKGFKRFLVDTPLDLEPVSATVSYGSQHGLYRLDGKLIAMAVLDVLPGAVSSVYFCWDSDYSGMVLGKLSALREAAMARELGGFAYMMGYYIHTCSKMKYKAEYQPSSLLDPETNVFYPWPEAKIRLDKHKHASFSRPLDDQPLSPPTTPAREGTPALSTSASASEDGELDVEWPDKPPPGCLSPDALPKELLFGTCVLEGSTLVPLLFSSAWHNQEQVDTIRQLLAATGEAFAGRIAIWVE